MNEKMDAFNKLLKEFIYSWGRRIIHGKSYRICPLNLFKTLWYNLRILPLKQALLFPIWIYSNVKIYRIGSIIIDCNLIRSGMIRIGNEGNSSRKNIIIENFGKITIKDSLSIFGGCYILNYGDIIFHGSNRLAEGVTLKILRGFELGYMSRLGTECYVIDSDFHYTLNLTNNTVKRADEKIVIGDYNWLGTRTFIKKGVITPNHIIVAAPNALLTKDYSAIPEYTVLGGAPAKPISFNIRRIYNLEKESYFNSLFNDKSDLKQISIQLGTNEIESFCDDHSMLL